MTVIGKVLRTTAFRLTVIYLLLFALFAVSLIGYFAWNTRRLVTEQITEQVNAEVADLRRLYDSEGIRGVSVAIDNRTLRPGASLYALTTPGGQSIAGNIETPPAATLSRPGWVEITYDRLDDVQRDPSHDHRALARVFALPGGFRVLVGRDLEERRRMFKVVVEAARWSFVVVLALGLFGGVFAARRVLKRIDAITGTTDRIMAGDLAERVPVGRSGDELDRLARSLNAMLERIEALMKGLKEVSDNIAHDLKTPLTRLRNRCERALAGPRDAAAYQAALEQTIEESDSLIRTFDALLMIARAEAGHSRDDMTAFDAAELVRDIFELYEPVAEESGRAIRVDAPVAVPMHGNRELISQALANLVENAIKYGAPTAAGMTAGATAAAMAGDGRDKHGDDIALGVRARGAMVELAVADRGGGIADADKARATERFVRLDESRSAPGSGLGLSLAAAVARLHGGELRLGDNRPGLVAILALPGRGSDRIADDKRSVTDGAGVAR